MSFLIEFRQIAPHIAARTSFTQVAPRAFSTSFVVRNSATETVKGAAKGVDRAVSDKLVDGIELGRMFASFLLLYQTSLHLKLEKYFSERG
jgi:translation elongation factor EF-Ts